MEDNSLETEPLSVLKTLARAMQTDWCWTISKGNNTKLSFKITDGINKPKCVWGVGVVCANGPISLACAMGRIIHTMSLHLTAVPGWHGAEGHWMGLTMSWPGRTFGWGRGVCGGGGRL